MIYCSQNIVINYPVVTMGTFDGVHLGHQELIKKVIERAAVNSGESIVITYYHHPKETLDENITPYLLTEKERKETLLKELGVDYVAFLNFDYQMSLLSAQEFLNQIIYQRFQAKEIVFGYDCHFGNNREGDYHFLEDNKQQYSYTPFIITPVKINNTIVSSSTIREHIRMGNIEEAALYLGRNYDLIGTVVPGKKIGRALGFPTVNIKPQDKLKLIPAAGVYLGKVYFDDVNYFCLTNVGFSPTLKDNNKQQVECHLLDFDGELYHKEVKVEFIKRIRDEIKFSSKEDLIAAINKDKEYALDYIAKYTDNGL